LGILLDAELSDDKDIQRQLRYQYCAANKLRASVPRCSNAVKNILFRSCDSTGFNPLYYVLYCLFLSTCVLQNVCVHTMDFVSAQTNKLN